MGYHFRTVDRKIEVLEEEIKKKIDKPKEEPKSLVVDPYDEVQNAQFELDQMNKKLNNE